MKYTDVFERLRFPVRCNLNHVASDSVLELTYYKIRRRVIFDIGLIFLQYKTL